MTSDPNDRASEQEQAMRDNAIRNSRKPEGPSATGQCLNCGSLLARGLRWCDSSCRDEWEAEQK